MTMETLRRRRRRRSRVDSNRSNNNNDVVEATPTTFVSEAGLSSHEIREHQHLWNDNYNAEPSRRRRQRRRSSAKKLGSLLLKKLNWGKKPVKKKSCILDDDDDDYYCVPDMSRVKPGSEEESSNISPLLGREIKFQDVNHNDDDDACNESSLVVDDDDGNDDVSDYDAYSTGSQQSLISDDDDDGEPIPSHLRGIERLEKKHQKRDERLQRLLLKKQQPQQPQQRRSKSFEMSMLRNEAAIREWQRNSFLMNDGGIERGGGGGGGRRQVRLGLSPLDQIKHGLLFESQVNANGLYSVLSYILATSAFYYIVDSVFTGLKYLLRESVSADTFYLVTFILGVAVMRMNGYLWKWLDEDSWEIMKLEMDNRDRLGYVDAKIFRWLKSNTRLKSFSNIICYNMVYIGLCHFYYIGLNQLAYAPATTWYDAVKLEATATAESMIPPASTATCEAYRDLVQGRLRGMFAYYLCADPNWSIIQTVYHTGMFVLAASIYAMMGSSFITAYD